MSTLKLCMKQIILTPCEAGVRIKFDYGHGSYFEVTSPALENALAVVTLMAKEDSDAEEQAEALARELRRGVTT